MTKLTSKMGTMTAVEQQEPPRRTRMPAAERRESILAAAAGVFAEAGYHAARVADIAARVGVSEPVVFQNFGSKPALFAAVLDRTAEQARVSVDDAAASYGSAAGLLTHVIAHAAGEWRPGGQAGTAGGHHQEAAAAGHGPETAPGALFAAAVALAADPAAPQERGPVLRTLAGHVADIVRRGQQDGSVRGDIDPESAAWLLVSLLAASPLTGAAMPAERKPAIAELTGRLLSPPPVDRVSEPAASRRGERHQGSHGRLIGAKRSRISVEGHRSFPGGRRAVVRRGAGRD
jgi:AcrR family transcriptional regulator